MSTKLHLTSWVCSIIEKNQGPVPKAHLVVAREFEDHSVSTFAKESASTSKDTLGISLSTITSNN